MPSPPVPRPSARPPLPDATPERKGRGDTTGRGANLPVSHEISAGGIAVHVVDGEANAATIGRRNRNGKLEWCLPKGHLEGDETPQEAAVREIAEEAGVHGEIIHSLGIIDYWFTGDDRRVHKVVHHFLLETHSDEITADNDPDQEAEVAEWVPLRDLANRLAYPNERRIAEVAAKLLVLDT